MKAVPGLLPNLVGVPKKYSEVRKILRAANWSIARRSGSHETWKSGDGSTAVTVAGKDSDTVPVGTLASMRRSTGINELR